LEGLSPVPDIPAEIRQHWREQGAALSATELHDALSARDAQMAGRLKPTDTQRIVRALEVIEASGTSLADWQETKGAPLIDSGNALKIVVAPERDQLYANIDTRFEAMLRAGAMEEVRAFAACMPDPDLPLMRAHGVRELMAHLEGALTLEEAAEKAKTESRRYAKRQMTWARRFMDEWTWLPNSAAAVAELGATVS
ncbi:MAG: tRNA (adenosine(37)-N6)-dimethylallyltransferase MiaA, partial [Pseudomonadota bacterium]